jgi:hypothetical protein
MRGFTGEEKHMLHAGFGNGLGLNLNLFQAELSAKDGVFVIKPTVGATIITVVGYIKWNKHLDRASKILHGQLMGFVRHGLKMSGSPGTQQRQKIHRAGFFLGQTTHDVFITHLVKKIGNIKITVLLNYLVE